MCSYSLSMPSFSGSSQHIAFFIEQQRTVAMYAMRHNAGTLLLLSSWVLLMLSSLHVAQAALVKSQFSVAVTTTGLCTADRTKSIKIALQKDVQEQKVKKAACSGKCIQIPLDKGKVTVGAAYTFTCSFQGTAKQVKAVQSKFVSQGASSGKNLTLCGDPAIVTTDAADAPTTVYENLCGAIEGAGTLLLANNANVLGKIKYLRPPLQVPGVVFDCAANCGMKSFIQRDTGEVCYCDYWCDMYGDCCGTSFDAAANANAKNLACPEMQPTLDLGTITSCRPGNHSTTNDPHPNCGTYRPAGCWCDGFCATAEDCCADCPNQCFNGSNQPYCAAPPNTPSSPGSASVVSSLDAVDAITAAYGNVQHTCQTRVYPAKWLQELNAVRAAGVVTPAFTRIQELLNKELACADATVGDTVDQLSKYTIPVVWTSISVNGSGGTYQLSQAQAMVEGLNKAYARFGIEFSFSADTFFTYDITNGPSITTDSCCLDINSTQCLGSSCTRCAAYEAIKGALAAKQLLQQDANYTTLFVYSIQSNLFPVPANGSIQLGAAVPPQLIMPPSVAVFAGCADGFWMREEIIDPKFKVESFNLILSTAVHEIGHWLGLSHTWAQGAQSREEGCATSTDYRTLENIMNNDSDAVRDTPPQDADGNGNPIFFQCDTNTGLVPSNDPDWLIPPAGSALVDQARSCRANDTGSAVSDSYYNNFYNTMSYYNVNCGITLGRKKTFTPGQIARARCVYACYRLGQCFDGTFPY